MSIVAIKSNKIVRNAISDLSLREGVMTSNIQLLIKYHNGSPEFFALQDYDKDLGHLPLGTLYPAWKDIFGIRGQIPLFLANLISEVCEEFNLEYNDVAIIVSERGKKDAMRIVAYKDGKILREFRWNDVFSNDSLMKIAAKQ